MSYAQFYFSRLPFIFRVMEVREYKMNTPLPDFSTNLYVITSVLVRFPI